MATEIRSQGVSTGVLQHTADLGAQHRRVFQTPLVRRLQQVVAVGAELFRFHHLHEPFPDRLEGRRRLVARLLLLQSARQAIVRRKESQQVAANRIRQIDDERDMIVSAAKAEALEQGSKAIDLLKELGFDFHLEEVPHRGRARAK